MNFHLGVYKVSDSNAIVDNLGTITADQGDLSGEENNSCDPAHGAPCFRRRFGGEQGIHLYRFGQAQDYENGCVSANQSPKRLLT
jgi:hypothetical protein